MFGTIIEYIALVLIASGVAGGLFLGRNVARLLSIRSNNEIVKAKIQNQALSHDFKVNEAQNNLKLMALTQVADSTKDESAEDVRVKKSDVFSPISRDREHEKMKGAAVDAEFSSY